MNNLSSFFGQGEMLNAWHMSARAVLVFFVTLVLIRIGGVRIYGKKSAFDIIIMIIMGAVLARGIVGASRLDSAIVSSTCMIVIHRLLAWLCIKSRALEIIIKGKARVIYQNQQILKNNLAKESLSEADFLQSLRLETKNSSPDDVDTAYMETNGRISFIVKKKKNSS
jgi:uncharacterized membrane protein YcaP (DUF421 family)